MLEVKDIHTWYGDSYVLQGVSLEVKDASIVTLLGRNGMGKTTTVRSIMGLTPPRRGSILYDGKEIVGLQPYKIARLGLGLVPQGRMVFPSLSVTENLKMAARTGDKQDPWTLDKVFAVFPKLAERRKNKGNLLSGGEQQMLTIARALMTNPDLMLFDEPSEGLAPVVVDEVFRVIRELKAGGQSILLVEQDFGMAMSVADHAYIMSKGTIVYESTPDKLIDNESVKSMYLGVGE
ncbi:MAG: ABC transporter ATP-binding protein [Actinobacteria bacterium RBG_13_63_9]|nr:MAG: ABC transporter ATP-binding protein [Actinobacteria bacterium RBG_13_63_9]